MKNRLNLLFYFCSFITLIILVLPAKFKVAYYSLSTLGYIYLFTLLLSIFLFIYLSYNDFKNKNKNKMPCFFRSSLSNQFPSSNSETSPLPSSYPKFPSRILLY